MKIEYDEAKRQENLEDRGIDFEDAVHVFNSERTISKIDDRKDYGEERVITMGLLAGRHVIVVHTTRGKNIRVISMRKANEREISWFEKQFEEN